MTSSSLVAVERVMRVPAKVTE